MVIQHNLSALNANRQLGVVSNSLEKSTKKLSSGYKINRAADDAAGLSISEKMRKQIRGLSQAAENIQDGISLCQVADGALNETIDVLQRMNELSVQAANGTNSISDRKDIQMEIDQLSSEINRIAETTCFNEWIYPLKSNAIPTLSSDVTWHWTLPSCLHEEIFTAKINNTCTYKGSTYQPGDSFTFSAITVTTEDDKQKNRFRWFTNNDQISGYFFSNNPRETILSGTGNYKDFNIKLSDLKFDNNGFIYYELNTVNLKPSKVYIIDKPTGFGDTTAIFGPSSFPASDNTNLLRGIKVTLSKNSGNSQNQLWIQSTDEAHKGLYINLVNATMKGLFSGTAALSVLTESDCDTSIDKISDALKVASGYRSYFGAVQNRLEHAYNINLNTVENTQFAESQIRDTNMSTEMVKHSNDNILAQVGQAMLTQANQSNQGVLSLIA